MHLKLFFDNGAESVNGKLNNLNIYAYLETVLLYMPDYKDEPEGIEDLMPWSEMIQQRCRIKSKS
ncbi:transposase domain-containing protein [Enterocloster clostridioformis]|nr:transposase domain-containing protein [Enterocloster clostridioformis]